MNSIILALVIVANAASAAQVGQAVLTLPGVVTDSRTGAPVAGARVGLVGEQAAQDEWTDAKGNFILTLSSTVKSGQIVRLRVDKEGFETYDENVPVGGALPRQVHLVPAKDPKKVGKSGPLGVSPKGKSPSPAPLTVAASHVWAMTKDDIIDAVERNLNAMASSKVPDAEMINDLRPLFNQPVFIDIREELPEPALFRLCRSKQILVFYANNFTDPTVRGEALYSAQKLIYAQDELGKIFGPTFSAQGHCGRYADDQKAFTLALPQRVLQPGDTDPKVSNILRDLRKALISIGLMDQPLWGPDTLSDQSHVSDGIAVLYTPGPGSASAVSVSIRTTGVGPQTIEIGVHPVKLLFEPPEVVLEEKGLPEDLQVNGHPLTIERFTASGFALNDHGAEISVKATVIEATRPADLSTLPGAKPPDGAAPVPQRVVPLPNAPATAEMQRKLFTTGHGAPTTTGKESPVVVAESEAAPQLIHRVDPSYPPLARQARIDGTVVLEIEIDIDGRVHKVDLISGHPMLGPAAVEAVKQWRYRPFLQNGSPAVVATTVTLSFSLSK